MSAFEEYADESSGRIERPRTVEEQAELADTPHLTGDPEWDAIEMAEVDPAGERLKVQRHGGSPDAGRTDLE